MKRGLIIIAAFVLFITAASARDYTYLEPPTLAVMDFEVSMSAVQIETLPQGALKETNRAFYGQLISQALLSVLVQQNAASVVITPPHVPAHPNAPLVDPGAPVYDPGTLAREEKAAQDAAKVKDQKKEAKQGQSRRYYVPPIFKIYDKKYVENALQNGSFTTKDLYTKAANAFAFADLDYLVLGNVYDTRYENRDAVGINVRVLNTKRAEELYAYSAVVDRDMHDLPDACARVCRAFMLDILNSHCGQFTITKGVSFTSVGSGAANDPRYGHTLYWQPQQVKQEDATLGASDHSNKRPVLEDQYYWILPGPFTVSLYGTQNQQLREIPFSVASGEIKNVTYEKQHFDIQRSSISVVGIAPTTSYTITIKPDAYHAQYWWEIFSPPERSGSLKVTFDNGECKVTPDGGADASDYKTEYRSVTNELVISGIPIGSYTIQATRNPPNGMAGIDGLWLVQSRLIVEGKSLPLVLPDTRGAKMQIGDFGIQEKKAVDAPQTTKVSFVLNPGFGYDGYIQISDSATEADKWLYWSGKEKITITNEYSSTDLDSPVSYTVWVGATDPGYPLPVWKSDTRRFLKSQIISARDTIEIINVAGMKAAAVSEAQENAKEWARLFPKKTEPEPTAASTAATGTTTATAAQKRTLTRTTSATSQPAQKSSKLFMSPAFVLGYGSYDRTSTSTVNDFVLGASTSVLYLITPTIGIGAGIYVDFSFASDDLGFAGTLNASFGDPSRAGIVYLLDVGYGTGFTVGGGMALMPAGITIGANYYTAGSAWSISMSVGYMLGL